MNDNGSSVQCKTLQLKMWDISKKEHYNIHIKQILFGDFFLILGLRLLLFEIFFHNSYYFVYMNLFYVGSGFIAKECIFIGIVVECTGIYKVTR